MRYAITPAMAANRTPPANSQTRALRRRDLVKWPLMVIRGTWELLRARLAMASIGPGDIKPLNQAAIQRAGEAKGAAADKATVERICFVLIHLSRLVPWRSDCVPQALAAQKWLATKGVASNIRIGVENPKDGNFGAHAWLMHGEDVVIGGDIDRYSVLISESA